MREDYYEEDESPNYGREYPKTVRLAGVIWIIFGGVLILNAGANFLLTLGAGGGAQAGSGGVGYLLGIIFGAVFIHVGMQSIKGTAKDTLGNGIGSIILGVLNGLFGTILILGGIALGGTRGVIALLLGGVGILCGIGLIAAGVLALVGRAEYRAWRLGKREHR